MNPETVQDVMRAVRQARLVLVGTRLTSEDVSYVKVSKAELLDAYREMDPIASVDAQWDPNDPDTLLIG